VRKSSRLENSQPRSVGAQAIATASSWRHRPHSEGPGSALRGSLWTSFGRHLHEAIYEAGFNASTRFCEKSTDMLGMRISRYCAGVANEEINSPSAKRSWAPCRLRRPRSVATTRRAAPRGDQSTFPQRAGASCTFAQHGRAGPPTTRARF
jgi:hypothetical protein